MTEQTKLPSIKSLSAQVVMKIGLASSAKLGDSKALLTPNPSAEELSAG